MEAELKSKITEYYTTYYRDDCSLPNWKELLDLKFSGTHLEKSRLEQWEKDFNFDFRNKKHFIVGAGTAELAVALKQHFNSEVYGIEPSESEFEIIKMQCRIHDIQENNFKLAAGENVPFADNQYDFVHCFMVLEHVSDTKRVIDEMLRIVKPAGRIIIHTPNYAFPEERHYKMYFPTFLPKFFGYLYLIIRGRSYKFYKTINRVTERGINRILIKTPEVKWYRVYKSNERKKGFLGAILNFLLFRKFIYPQQEIILWKNKE